MSSSVSITRVPLLTVDTSAPSLSLPARQVRDVRNESPLERLQNDLSAMRGSIQNNLVRTMDKRRKGLCMDDAERKAFLEQVDAEESALWDDLHAVERILKMLST
jgi:hypothetical protein